MLNKYIFGLLFGGDDNMPYVLTSLSTRSITVTANSTYTVTEAMLVTEITVRATGGNFKIAYPDNTEIALIPNSSAIVYNNLDSGGVLLAPIGTTFSYTNVLSANHLYITYFPCKFIKIQGGG